MAEERQRMQDGGREKPPRRVLSIGECMVELKSAGNGLYAKGFAGDTFNTAWYLRRQLPSPEWAVGYLSAVGDDAESESMVRFIAASGVETKWLRRIAGRAPGLYMIHLDGAERSFTYWREASAARQLGSDADHLARAFAAADALYFSGITLAILSAEDRTTLLGHLGSAKAAGKTVAFDPNIRHRLWPDKDAMRRAIEAGAGASTICLPSFVDEAEAFGDRSKEETAARYLAAGAGEVVVKDGGDPALLATPSGTSSIEAGPVGDAVDTTGAGDSFSAAYLAARLQGTDPAAAARSGHDLAGQVIRHRGALIGHNATS